MLYLNNEFFNTLPRLHDLNISIYTAGQVRDKEYCLTVSRASCYDKRYSPLQSIYVYYLTRFRPELKQYLFSTQLQACGLHYLSSFVLQNFLPLIKSTQTKLLFFHDYVNKKQFSFRDLNNFLFPSDRGTVSLHSMGTFPNKNLGDL